jgi:orotidine-5'-phosphate decarboxylase
MFFDRLQERINQMNAPCCVGLDPILEQIPLQHRAAFGLTESDTLLRLAQIGGIETAAKCIQRWLISEVLEQIRGTVPAVKPQMAYFEQLGPEGMKVLQNVTHAAKKMGFIVILDGKRGDIGSTSEAYANAYLDPRISGYYADALTVAPYMGDDSVGPFVEKATQYDKGVFCLVRTTNPGSARMQLTELYTGRPSFMLAAYTVMEINMNAPKMGVSGPCGVVVGATDPDSAKRIRELLPTEFFLVPGYGVQGGSRSAVEACFTPGGNRAIVNSARAVLYPKEGSVTAACAEFINEVRSIRDGV